MVISLDLHHSDAADIQGFLRKCSAFYADQVAHAPDEKKEAYYRRQAVRAAELADMIGRRTDAKIGLKASKGEAQGVKGGGLPEGASTSDDEPEAIG